VPPTLADRLVHILESIRNIQELLAGKSRDDFAKDLLLRLAVERAFEIISEASRRIPDEIKTRQTQIDWQGMAALGNRLRHAYHRVDVNILIDIAERDLPPLRSFIEQVIQNEKP
jgi:uncharacterized protein with HEPN domain